MKDLFENNIKQSFENFELPYNPKAWDAMKTKLDQAKPVAKPPYKWFIAAGVAITASIVAYSIWATMKTDSPVQKTEVELQSNTPTTNKVEKIAQPSSENKTPTFTTESESNVTVNHNDNSQEPATTTSASHGNSHSNNVNNGNGDSSNTGAATNGNDENGQKSGVGTTVNGQSQSSDAPFVLPEIGQICEGTTFAISNTNSLELIIKYPNDVVWTCDENSNAKLFASQSGTYQMGYFSKGNFVSKGTFVVDAAPRADFEIVRADEKYDEFGIPATYVSTDVTSTSYNWKFDQTFAEGKESVAHFFKQGKHEITLTVEGANGCTNQFTKEVNIVDNYNLMAVNSFIPTSSKAELNRFMPFSLTVRGDKFRLIILDPRDGHLVYETTDPSQGWDGVDVQTGNMVKYETAFIWKVTIDNPKPGENSDYAGTIIPLADQ